MKARHNELLILFFLTFLFSTSLIYIWHISKSLPEELYIYSNKDTVVNLDIPVTGVIKETNQTIDFSKPVTFQAKEKGDYSLEYKLFNLISLPSGKLSVLEENYLYAGGFPVGLYIKTHGVFVADTADFTNENGQVCSPSKNYLSGGDYIVDINGISISKKKEISGLLECSDGDALCIGFIRNDEYNTVNIKPEKNENAEYKLGIWVKDDAQGIGTITYIDKNGNYGALGHGMSDSSTNSLLNISNGFLYKTNIISITQGHENTPGEYIGTIDYSYNNQLGLINSNTKYGMFGTFPASKCDNMIKQYNLKAYEIGFKREAHKGTAYISVYLDGQLKLYDIEIEDIAYRNEKNITFRCTSDDLLEITNGIVQGMSGCPIIQDDKIIGAVTHVFVNDSHMGYGIFIENMIAAD